MMNINTISEMPHVSAINEESGNTKGESDSPVRNGGKAVSTCVEELTKRSKEQAASIERLDNENSFLRKKVDPLSPLGLPRPHRVRKTRKSALSRTSEDSDDSGSSLVLLVPRTAKNTPSYRRKWLFRIFGRRS